MAAFGYIRSKTGALKGIGQITKMAISSLGPYFGWQPKVGPLYVGWDFAYDCNARCGHCGRWKVNDDTNIKLSTDEIRRVARELKETGARFICIAGGEPLLVEDLGDIIRYMKKIGFSVSLCTNGILLAEKADALISSGLDHVIVSVDGGAQGHDYLRGVKGSFYLAEAGINSIIHKRTRGQPTVSVRMLVHENNIDEIPFFVSRWDKIVDSLLLQPLHNGTHNLYELQNDLHTVSSIAKLRTILKKMGLDANFYNSLMPDYLEDPSSFRHLPCLAGHWVVRITPSGDVYPCVEQLEHVGNLRQQSFREIWKGNRFNCARKLLAKTKNCSCFYNDMFMNIYMWKAHAKLPVLRQILSAKYSG